ncbi:unnamed protein product [Pylaiella littoralis]
MAKYYAFSLGALLLMACFMNSGRSFVVHQGALIMRSSSCSSSSSWRQIGSSIVQRGRSSSSLVQKARCSRRYRTVGMKVTEGTAAAGGGSGAGADQPRSGRTRISAEGRDTGAGVGAAANASSRNQGPAGEGVAFLSGNEDNNATDSGDDGVNAGGIGGGGGGGGQGGSGGDGKKGDGQGGGEDNQDGSEELEIAAKGRRRARIIRRVDIAVKKGKIPKESSKDYAKLLTSPLMALLCKNSSWRARLLGDTTFMTKLAIEMVTGTMAQFLAEYQKRGKKFMEELDFVFADTLTCLFANFAAVWLSCPTVAVKAVCKKEAAKAGGALQKFIASCPSNAFQKVAAEGGVSTSFSVAQRGGALLLPMPKLFVIGFGATLAGYGLIAGLETVTAMINHAKCPKAGGESLKKRMSKAEVAALAEEKPPVPVLGSGLAVGVFLAVWTNFRYQFIAGAVEQRVFDTLLATKPGLSSLASTAVRSANLYIGSLTVVDWLRYVGLQH